MMYNNKMKLISPILASIISVFLFVTIITANPTTITGDLNTKEIQSTKVVSAIPANDLAPNPAPPSPSASQSAPQSTPPKTNSPTTPVKQIKPQPSRSASALTGTPTTKPTTTRSITQSTKASSIISTSKQYLGVNYLYGGTTPAGFDCSGFVQYVFAKNGISLPRVSRDQYKVGTSVSFSNLQPGDLVFFSMAKNGAVDHDGIYVGNGQFINAASSKGVTIYTFGPYWNSVYLGAKRVL